MQRWFRPVRHMNPVPLRTVKIRPPPAYNRQGGRFCYIALWDYACASSVLRTQDTMRSIWRISSSKRGDIR